MLEREACANLIKEEIRVFCKDVFGSRHQRSSDNLSTSNKWRRGLLESTGFIKDPSPAINHSIYAVEEV